MFANRSSERLYLGRQADQVMLDLHRRLAVDFSLAANHPQTLEPFPLLPADQVVGNLDDDVLSHFVATVAAFHAAAPSRREVGADSVFNVDKELPDGVEESRMVFLERQHVVSAALDDLGGDV